MWEGIDIRDVSASHCNWKRVKSGSLSIVLVFTAGYQWQKWPCKAMTETAESRGNCHLQCYIIQSHLQTLIFLPQRMGEERLNWQPVVNSQSIPLRKKEHKNRHRRRSVKSVKMARFKKSRKFQEHLVTLLIMMLNKKPDLTPSLIVGQSVTQTHVG